MADFIRIGSAWKKRSKNGNDYISIQLNEESIKGLDLVNMNIMLMKNMRKESPKQPDYQISAIEREDRQNTQQNQAPQKPKQAPKNFAPGADNNEDEFGF